MTAVKGQLSAWLKEDPSAACVVLAERTGRILGRISRLCGRPAAGPEATGYAVGRRDLGAPKAEQLRLELKQKGRKRGQCLGTSQVSNFPPGC